jgi:hypothetical protein
VTNVLISEQEFEQGAEIQSLHLLTPLEAAYHLGITPELLFAYTRSRFRKSRTEARRLGTVEVDGTTRFNRIELDDFDRYLQQLWADPGSRTDPPK